MADPTPRSGTLLIAPPLSNDPNFHRTVVLVCEHGPDGSFGLVLNRALDATLEDVLEGPDVYPAPLSLGGPVQPDTLHYLHRCAPDVPGAIEVVPEVCWGGDFDALRAWAFAHAATSANVRFFLGYSGWSPGQLEAEVEAGGWILAEADAEAVFADDPDRLWRLVLRRMGGEYALLANFPDDPRLN